MGNRGHEYDVFTGSGAGKVLDPADVQFPLGDCAAEGLAASLPAESRCSMALLTPLRIK